MILYRLSLVTDRIIHPRTLFLKPGCGCSSEKLLPIYMNMPWVGTEFLRAGGKITLRRRRTLGDYFLSSRQNLISLSCTEGKWTDTFGTKRSLSPWVTSSADCSWRAQSTRLQHRDSHDDNTEGENYRKSPFLTFKNRASYTCIGPAYRYPPNVAFYIFFNKYKYWVF
jgi:hypothetical protein